MVDSLHLNSLEIRGYRGFRHLKIERLGRVNLIVGKNNVGKSTLLEALWLYAHRGAPAIIWQILEARDEGIRLVAGATEHHERAAVKHLFRGRPDIRTHQETIYIGPMDDEENVLSIGIQRRQIPPFIQNGEPEDPSMVLSIGMGSATRGSLYYLDHPGVNLWDVEPLPAQCVFAAANGLGPWQVVQLWDAIALTNLEKDVVASLQIIAPQLERVNLVSSPQRRAVRGTGPDRVPLAKMSDTDEPIPLRSLGEGMNRLFGIALALVNAKDGMLLIDEVESGIHYSVLADLWRLVFEAARRLNVQVFATTHSWDCIQAFQEAAQENTDEEGLLIRLRNLKGNIVADPFDERQLSVVTREKIEVR